MLRSMVDALQLISLKGGATARELGDALGLPRSTAHRLVAQLLDIGFIERGSPSSVYILGPLIGDLAGGSFAHRSLVLHCRSEMEALRDSSGETVAVHIMQSGRRVLLDQAESKQELRWVFGNPLVPMPLHAGAAAKMLLALVPDTEVRRIVKRGSLVKYTPRTPQDYDRLLAELTQIRQRGHAASIEEVTPGVASFAVPLISKPIGGQPLAVLCLTGPLARWSASRQPSLLKALQATARRARQRLQEAFPFDKQAA